MRLGALFVAVCMTVIAASAGAVVYFAYGFSGADAIIVAIAALTALALYNAVSTRMNVRSVVGPQLTELSRGGADLARQVAELGRRLAVVESRMERSLTKGEATIEPLAVEISELGALVDQLAETVALHETQLSELERTQQRARAAARPEPARQASSRRARAARPARSEPAVASGPRRCRHRRRRGHRRAAGLRPPGRHPGLIAAEPAAGTIAAATAPAPSATVSSRCRSPPLPPPPSGHIRPLRRPVAATPPPRRGKPTRAPARRCWRPSAAPSRPIASTSICSRS